MYTLYIMNKYVKLCVKHCCQKQVIIYVSQLYIHLVPSFVFISSPSRDFY